MTKSVHEGRHPSTQHIAKTAPPPVPFFIPYLTGAVPVPGYPLPVLAFRILNVLHSAAGGASSGSAAAAFSSAVTGASLIISRDGTSLTILILSGGVAPI